MNIQFPNSPLERVSHELLVLFHFEDQLLPRGYLARVDWILNGLVSKLLYIRKFQGLRSEPLLLSPSNKLSVEKILVWGLGRKSDLGRDTLLEAYSSATFVSAKMKTQSIAFTVPEEAFCSITNDAGENLLRTILIAADQAGMPLHNLNLAFYEKDQELRNILLASLRKAIPQISADFSLGVSFP